MNTDCISQAESLLEPLGLALNVGISLIDKDYNIIWVNSILEKKGFLLRNVKGTFYHKTFDNVDTLETDDPTYRALQEGKVIHTIKRGNDGREYTVLAIPLRNEKDKVELVLELNKNVDDYNNDEIQRLKDFIFERELKMVELKKKIKELEGR